MSSLHCWRVAAHAGDLVLLHVVLPIWPQDSRQELASGKPAQPQLVVDTTAADVGVTEGLTQPPQSAIAILHPTTQWFLQWACLIASHAVSTVND